MGLAKWSGPCGHYWATKMFRGIWCVEERWDCGSKDHRHNISSILLCGLLLKCDSPLLAEAVDRAAPPLRMCQ